MYLRTQKYYFLNFNLLAKKKVKRKKSKKFAKMSLKVIFAISVILFAIVTFAEGNYILIQFLSKGN